MKACHIGAALVVPQKVALRIQQAYSSKIYKHEKRFAYPQNLILNFLGFRKLLFKNFCAKATVFRLQEVVFLFSKAHHKT